MTPSRRPSRRWQVVAAVEVVLSALAVIFDLAIPTFVILALMVVSLLIHRQGLSTMGFHRVHHASTLAAKMLALAAAWTLLDIGLLKPVENHLTGVRQDMSQFISLKGHVGMLITWVVLAWVVAGVGETLAFVGFVQTRITEVLGSTGARLGAVVLSSVLLGLLHTEYGIVGVSVSAVNGISTVSCAALQHAVGADPGARVHRHHRLGQLLRRRTGLRAVVSQQHGPRPRH
jgi:membrane protease YdiL (CAAX protease family)